MRITKLTIAIAVCVGALVPTVYAQTIKPTKTNTPTASAPQKPAVATSVSYLTKQEQDLLTEINFARANPVAYIPFLEQYKKYYDGKLVRFPGGSMLVTNEGVAALEDAIAFLRTLKPLPPLEIRKGMVSGAKVHLDDMRASQRSGHTGSDGSKPEDRLSRFGSWQDSVGENIVYETRSARNDVIGLIIDDGVATRGHRKNLFKTTFKVIGISYGGPVNKKTIAVITFAGGFLDKGDSKKPTATAY